MAFLKFTQPQTGDAIYIETNEIQFFRPSPQDQRNTEIRLHGVTITVAQDLAAVKERISHDGYSFEDEEDTTPPTFGQEIKARLA